MHQKSVKWTEAFLPAIFWGGLILVLSTKGGINMPDSLMNFFEVDKLGHAVFYGVFTFLICWGFKRSGKPLRTSFGLAFLIAGVYGVMLEFVQFAFFPGRYFEVLDIVANISGATLSWLFVRYFLI